MLDDRTGPVFQMDSRTIEVSVKDGQEALVKGLTATDAKDGDILATEPINSYPSPFVAIYKSHGLDFFDSPSVYGS